MIKIKTQSNTVSITDTAVQATPLVEEEVGHINIKVSKVKMRTRSELATDNIYVTAKNMITLNQIHKGVDDAAVQIYPEPTIVAVPTLSGTYTYTGQEQTVTISTYDPLHIAVSGDTAATNAGIYTVVFSLVDTDADVWEDGTTEDKTATWAINSAYSVDDLTLISNLAENISIPSPSYRVNYTNYTNTLSAQTTLPDGVPTSKYKTWAIRSDSQSGRARWYDVTASPCAILVKREIYESNAFAKTVSVGGVTYSAEISQTVVYRDPYGSPIPYVVVSFFSSSDKALGWWYGKDKVPNVYYIDRDWDNMAFPWTRDGAVLGPEPCAEVVSLTNSGVLTTLSVYYYAGDYIYNVELKARKIVYQIPDYGIHVNYSAEIQSGKAALITAENTIRNLALAIGELDEDEQAAIQAIISNYSETTNIMVNASGQFTIQFLSELSYKKYVDGTLEEENTALTYGANEFLLKVIGYFE